MAAYEIVNNHVFRRFEEIYSNPQLDERMTEVIHEIALAAFEVLADLGRIDLSTLQRFEPLALITKCSGEGDRLAETDVHRAELSLKVFSRAQ